MEAAATMTTESLTQRSCLALRVLLDNSGRRVQETYRCCCRKVACMQASGVWRDGDHLLADRPLDSLGLRPLHFEDANVEAQATSEWSISYLKGQLQLVQCHASELLRVICTTLILAKDDQHRSAVLSKLTTIIQPLLQVLQEANATLSASLKLQTVLQHRLDDDYPEEVTAVVRQCRMSSDQQRLSASAAGYYEQAVEQLVDVEVHCQAMMARLHYMSSTLLRDVLRVQRGTGDITLPKSAIKHWVQQHQLLASSIGQAAAAVDTIALPEQQHAMHATQKDSSTLDDGNDETPAVDSSEAAVDEPAAIGRQRTQPVETFEHEALPSDAEPVCELSEAEKLEQWKMEKAERARQRALRKTLEAERRLEAARTRRLLSELQGVIQARGGLREEQPRPSPSSG
eukprot:TRINITY_DN10992_c0_g1_i2.p1 TRINITY_DN10992_c0_g1~~TRINITY_DN10992_c0_g1_i2.p1  ORF type:complete len:401 (+),score=93.83 TRINITY_DN10992_c0_g1_i2:685-1887(+)